MGENVLLKIEVGIRKVKQKIDKKCLELLALDIFLVRLVVRVYGFNSLKTFLN